jgi:galactitol-specific phosphotransferase system IIB component
MVEGLSFICDALLEEEGISKVELGRKAINERVVSQDMEIYVTTKEVDDGFNMVARAGTCLQEIHVTTPLSRTEMKEAIKRVLDRLP